MKFGNPGDENWTSRQSKFVAGAFETKSSHGTIARSNYQRIQHQATNNFSEFQT